MSLSNQLDTLSIDEIQDVATELMVKLSKGSLVHILIDMVDPKVMLENILKTKEDTDSLAKTMEEKGFPNWKGLPVCYACLDIYKEVEEALKPYTESLLH